MAHAAASSSGRAYAAAPRLCQMQKLACAPARCGAFARPAAPAAGRPLAPPRAHTVQLQLVDGRTETVSVEEGDNILDAALEAGLDVSHDCKMGVCMTCPAKLVTGQVDQSAGMLDDEAREKGYTLLCVSEPQSDCHIQIIEEDELLEQVLCSSSNIG